MWSGSACIDTPARIDVHITTHAPLCCSPAVSFCSADASRAAVSRSAIKRMRELPSPPPLLVASSRRHAQNERPTGSEAGGLSPTLLEAAKGGWHCQCTELAAGLVE